MLDDQNKFQVLLGKENKHKAERPGLLDSLFG